MKTNKKYLHVTANQEPNIAVLELTKVPTSPISDDVVKHVKKKLQTALEEHFDADIEIKSLEFTHSHPLTGRAVVIISDDMALKMTIELTETWVY